MSGVDVPSIPGLPTAAGLPAVPDLSSLSGLAANRLRLDTALVSRRRAELETLFAQVPAIPEVPPLP